MFISKGNIRNTESVVILKTTLLYLFCRKKFVDFNKFKFPSSQIFDTANSLNTHLGKVSRLSLVSVFRKTKNEKQAQVLKSLLTLSQLTK